MKVLSLLVFVVVATASIAQVSLSTINSPYTQDFNTLASTGTSNTFLPTGWLFSESGSGANSTYAAGTGSDNTGNTYSFGAASNSDRALGGVQSGSLISTFGASFTNNTGLTITTLNISYFGEQWRLGATSRTDRIDFQYSLNATSLTSGTWINIDPLDFTAPTTTGTAGALNGNASANRTSVSNSITGLSIANGTTFFIRWTDFNASGADDGLGVDDFSITPQSNVTNSITSGSISGAPFSVDCTTGAAGSISFSSTGTFNASNSYTAQLSDASGNFASPTNIGSLNSTANTGNIPITIPSGTASGAGYLIRIVSSDPVITGSNSGSFTVTLSGGPCTLTPPYMTSLIYDGCNVTCSGSSTEGRSEIIFGNTGGYSVAVNPTNVRFIYNTNSNQPLTSGIVNNTANTANLNTEAGCPGLFLDGFGQTLGPNTSFLVVSENLCISSLIWSDLCGSGPIYVLYASASPSTWNDAGNFGNTAGTRNLQTIITATDGSVHDISYSYTSVNGGDGSYATWTSAGGTPATSGIFSNCRLTPVALPTGITFFIATFDKPNNQLYWQSHSEQNNDFYTLQHSTDGVNYNEIGKTQGAGNSSSLINYSFSHNRPPRGINYYKLTSTDYDGATYYKGITAVMVEGEGTYFDPLTSQLKFNETSDYSIFTAEGKLILTIDDQDSTNFDYHGMIIIQDHRKLTVERIFVP
jgi:hypothetical protein